MRHKLFFLSTVALTLASCSDNEVDGLLPVADGSLQFGAYLSRATSATSDNLDNFGVFAYYDEGHDFASGTKKPNFMYNQQVSKSGNEWTYNPIKYWPNNGSEKLSFFAYAPYLASEEWNKCSNYQKSSMIKVATCEGQNPQIYFQVGEEVEDQQDLIYAAAIDKTNKDGTVNFNFRHALARVGFNVIGWEEGNTDGFDSNTTVTINSIQMTTKHVQAVFDLITETWSDPVDYSTPIGYTFSSKKSNIQNNVITSADTGKKRLNPDNDYIMMFPDMSGSDRYTVFVDYTVSTSDNNLDGGNYTVRNNVYRYFTPHFEAGKAYTINIHLGMNGYNGSDDGDMIGIDPELPGNIDPETPTPSPSIANPYVSFSMDVDNWENSSELNISAESGAPGEGEGALYVERRLYGTPMSSDVSRAQDGTNAFDDNLSTYYASNKASFGWCGVELDQPYYISQIGYAPNPDAGGSKKMLLGVFQGANNPDFSDALPLHLIKKTPKPGQLTYAYVNCSRPFKYVRYVGPSGANSQIAEFRVFGRIKDKGEERYYQVTNLPTVVVNTPDMTWFPSKEYGMEGSNVYVIDNHKIDTEATAQIRGRGNASWGFPKKPFRIKFDDKQKVLGGPASAKKWTMINNYGDKSLMRNMLAFEISRRFNMDWTSVCHPVDLIFNGEYQGCYQLCDQVEVNKNRVNITKMQPEDVEGESLTGGYLIEIDAYASSEPDGEWFRSTGGHNIPVTIKAPDPGISQQFNYIRDHFSLLETTLFSPDFTDEENGYRRYLDLDSFLKHFLIGELAGNTDTYWSVYMSLDRGSEHFRTGPVWDFDLGFDNDNRTYPIDNRSDFICFSGGSVANGMNHFIDRVIKQDPAAKQRIYELWWEARNNGGIDGSLVSLVSEYEDMLNESQKLNFTRWPILGTPVHQNPTARGSYEEEVKAVRNYLQKRITKMDQLVNKLAGK